MVVKAGKKLLNPEVFFNEDVYVCCLFDKIPVLTHLKYTVFSKKKKK